MWYLLISIPLIIFYAVWLIYYCSGWDKLHSPGRVEQPYKTKVAVIIPARNEEKNIAACIESILHQSYPLELIEIIVVDDFSDDNTALIVKKYEPSVRLILLREVIKDEQVRSYKKVALTEAIKHTNAELIITTDADCIAGKRWIETMVNCYNQTDAVCVAGPVLIKQDNNFFNELQALDMAAFTGIAAAAIAIGTPVLCNGANFAFTKEAFISVCGYEDVRHITSGDDLLLLHKFNKKFPGKIAFCFSTDAVVETLPAENLPAFLNQRLRWASKSASYSNKRVTLILALVYMFYLSIIVSFVLSLIAKKYVYLLMAQLFIKLFADAFFMKRVLNFFDRRSLFSIFLPGQIFHMVYVLIIGAASLVIPVKWKGRKVYR